MAYTGMISEMMKPSTLPTPTAKEMIVSTIATTCERVWARARVRARAQGAGRGARGYCSGHARRSGLGLACALDMSVGKKPKTSPSVLVR